MADMEKALRKRFLDDGVVAGIVGTRVYWDERPQGKPVPDLTLTTISDPRGQHLKGYQGARETRVQADCRAANFDTVRKLALAVIAAVASPATVLGVRFTRCAADGPRSLNEDVNGERVFRRSVDFLIWHTGD